MTDNRLSIEFLNPEECSFKFNDNGFLVFTFKNESKGRVKLIRSIKDLDESSYSACSKELESRYYCPCVTSVKSIKERMGHFYFETIIDGKEKSFTVRDLTRNLRFSSENTLLIFDVDGNRYIIPEYEKIEQKSRRLLEPYLY